MTTHASIRSIQIIASPQGVELVFYNYKHSYTKPLIYRCDGRRCSTHWLRYIEKACNQAVRHYVSISAYSLISGHYYYKGR